MLANAIAFVGHRVHVVRGREVGTLLEWAGPLRGKRVLDVAGGDGWWAGQLRRQGARPTALDIDVHKLARGATYARKPDLVRGDALRLPFVDASFDVVLSVCAIEHFDDGPAALAEMARVLTPDGDLLLSADTLSRAGAFPDLARGHANRYHVVRTYDHQQLGSLMSERGLRPLRHRYLFKGERGEKLYLNLSRHRLAWNLAAPLAAVVARADRLNAEEGGSVVLIHARKT